MWKLRSLFLNRFLLIFVLLVAGVSYLMNCPMGCLMSFLIVSSNWFIWLVFVCVCLQWLVNHDTSPMTNTRLGSKTIVPNYAMRRLLADVNATDRAPLRSSSTAVSAVPPSSSSGLLASSTLAVGSSVRSRAGQYLPKFVDQSVRALAVRRGDS
jgi:hypothetical protein